MTQHTSPATAVKTEADEILEILREQRRFLRLTVRGLDDERATRRTTDSGLTLAGLVKHVARTERGWIAIMNGRTENDPDREASWGDDFRLVGDETLEGTLAFYAGVEAETEKAVAALPSLDHPAKLPEAPWFPKDASWSARRILLHLIRETAQHCGHADIIRESLDGATTTEVMGEAVEWGDQLKA
ncbi:DinB family protein [Nocardiopsis sp. RSe5-2]|uniref:DinB family protein n=1 Tax=Nocardiopsis endophytica TaxID=3018445 RepID=A0ABT4TY69_9ACTN|nr:DinB family protein [Nocardiopsis endophytica]MDA2809640.1 DinB family protein [Nocardiopsis endophytica]